MTLSNLLGEMAAGSIGSSGPQPVPSVSVTTTYHRTEVESVNIFYREAGPKDAPTVVLLHGFRWPD